MPLKCKIVHQVTILQRSAVLASRSMQVRVLSSSPFFSQYRGGPGVLRLMQEARARSLRATNLKI